MPNFEDNLARKFEEDIEDKEIVSEFSGAESFDDLRQRVTSAGEIQRSVNKTYSADEIVKKISEIENFYDRISDGKNIELDMENLSGNPLFRPIPETRGLRNSVAEQVVKMLEAKNSFDFSHVGNYRELDEALEGIEAKRFKLDGREVNGPELGFQLKRIREYFVEIAHNNKDKKDFSLNIEITPLITGLPKNGNLREVFTQLLNDEIEQMLKK